MGKNLITRDKFIRLAKKETQLRQKGRLLSNDNEIEYRQYLAYSRQLEQQFFFQRKLTYLGILKNYLMGHKNAERMKFDFFNIYYPHFQEFQSLMLNPEKTEEINSDPKINLFMENFRVLFDDCESLGDFVTETDFRQSMEKIYAEMKTLI